ncbi:MAG: TatD family nuclease-associated radical SAM protein [Endomicrobia bacterium]|nr:TatD family nuclease-associated radical SAM protein [Endomicrobiia bacterium]
MGEIVYFFKNNLYISITNRCPMQCVYCMKYKWDFNFYGYNLKLDKEPTVQEVITELEKKLKEYPEIKEIVYCGYGEPLLRYKEVLEITKFFKEKYPNLKVRVNTDGLIDKSIPKKLKGVVDSISISLNAHDEETFRLLHKTKVKQPLKKIIDFIKEAKKNISVVYISTITHPKVQIDKIKEISRKLKVKFKEREYY